MWMSGRVGSNGSEGEGEGERKRIFVDGRRIGAGPTMSTGGVGRPRGGKKRVGDNDGEDEGGCCCCYVPKYEYNQRCRYSPETFTARGRTKDREIERKKDSSPGEAQG